MIEMCNSEQFKQKKKKKKAFIGSNHWKVQGRSRDSTQSIKVCLSVGWSQLLNLPPSLPPLPPFSLYFTDTCCFTAANPTKEILFLLSLKSLKKISGWSLTGPVTRCAHLWGQVCGRYSPLRPGLRGGSSYSPRRIWSDSPKRGGGWVGNKINVSHLCMSTVSKRSLNALSKVKNHCKQGLEKNRYISKMLP